MQGKKKKVRLLILLFVIIAIIIICFLFTSTVSKRELTITNMIVLRRELNNFYLKFKSLPNDIRELGDIGCSSDGWGNKIVYHFDNGVVTLLSYGKDNKAGGEKENADIKGSFKIDEPITNWISWPE